MKKRHALGFALLSSAISAAALPAGFPGCRFKTIDKAIVIREIDYAISRPRPSTFEVDRFEIENRGSTAIRLHGTKHDSDFRVGPPYASVQALMNDGNWRALDGAPNGPKTQSDELLVPPDSKATFTTYFRFWNILGSTGELRLMMQDSELHTCFLSEPF